VASVNCFEKNVDFIFGRGLYAQIDEFCELIDHQFVVIRTLFYDLEKVFYCLLSVFQFSQDHGSVDV
jgi:hypothetical protein